MNLQDIWRWLKGTRQGRFVLLFVAFLLVLYFVATRSPKRKVKPDNRAIAVVAGEPVTKAEGYHLQSNIPQTEKAIGPSPTPLPILIPSTKEVRRSSPTPAPLPMRIFSAVEDNAVSEEFLPGFTDNDRPGRPGGTL